MPEIELNRDTVRFIIETAREFHTRRDVVLEEIPEIPTEDWSLPTRVDGAADPYYEEMKTTINDLEPDQQVSLVALMWVGRGDFSSGEWADALKLAGERWTKHTADYLIGTAMLADYLSEGLEQIETDEAD